MKMNSVINISRINLTYSTENGSLQVLKNLNLSVKEGEFLSIIGPSGCGKSTLLKLIGDLLQPTDGEILIKGKTPSISRKERKFGFVFQYPVLFEWRSVLKNVQLPAEIFGDNHIKAKSQQFVDLVGLSGFENALPKQLSGGMQSRVAIARALIYEPEILLMDECFGDLDEITRDRMNLELLRIWENTHQTIVFVTHSIPEAVFLSDRVAVMSPRPSKISDIIEVNIERPRKISSKDLPRFIEITKMLRDKLEIEF